MLGSLVDKFFLFLLFFGLPLLLLAEVYHLAKPTDKRKKHRKIVRIFALSVVFISILIDFTQSYHKVNALVDKRFNFKISALEHDSFLDWPVDFWITIDAIEARQTVEFELETGNGASFEFWTKPNCNDSIYLNGYSGLSGQIWLIDFSDSSLTTASFDPIEELGFRMKGKLTNDFEFEPN